VVAGAELDHLTDTFVAGNERGLRLDRPVAVGGVEVGVADARGDELDEGLVVSGSGQVDVLDDDRGAELLDDSSGERIGSWGRSFRLGKRCDRDANKTPVVTTRAFLGIGIPRRPRRNFPVKMQVGDPSSSVKM
jgi:hypothetical protein